MREAITQTSTPNVSKSTKKGTCRDDLQSSVVRFTKHFHHQNKPDNISDVVPHGPIVGFHPWPQAVIEFCLQCLGNLIALTHEGRNKRVRGSLEYVEQVVDVAHAEQSLLK